MRGYILGAMLLWILLAALHPQATAVTRGPLTPAKWVAFSAELRIEHPARPLAFGRFLQDEHGCNRRETVHPDGSLLVAILNFDTEMFYQLMRGSWTSQPMRLVPGIPRRPAPRTVDRKVAPVEGYEAFRSVSEVKGPRGKLVREAVIVPELNYFEAVTKHVGGETISAHNIRLGSPDHAEFLPPPGAAVAEREGFGGAMVFQGLSLRVTFTPSGPSIDVETGEEKPALVTTPSREQVFLVARALEGRTDVLRIRVMKNAEVRGPGRIEGEVIEELEFPFSGTATTTRLVENFSIALRRIGARQIR